MADVSLGRKGLFKSLVFLIDSPAPLLNLRIPKYCQEKLFLYFSFSKPRFDKYIPYVMGIVYLAALSGVGLGLV